MGKTYLVLIFTLLLVGCAPKVVEVNSSKKMFEGEDLLIFEALDALEKRKLKTSKRIFDELYERSGKSEYKKESIALLIKLNRFDEAIEEATTFLKSGKRDANIQKLLVGAYIQKSNFEEALREMLKVLDADRSEGNLELVASIYFGLEQYDMAIKYLESAYALDNSSRVMDKLSNTIYLFSERKNDAISYLESHIRIYGCERILCEKLSRIYREEKRFEQLLETSLRLYEAFGDDLYAKNIVEIYLTLGQRERAIEFLKSNNFDDRMLMEIYRISNDFKSAKELAGRLYKKTHDSSFLAQEAIFEYEFDANKSSKKMLDSVIEKLEKALNQEENDVYANFLGYILIDHDVDYKKGLKYVRDALKANPDSAYYLDSLAWGYYKLGMCEKARETMQRVVDMIGEEEEEVKEHWELIKKCK